MKLELILLILPIFAALLSMIARSNKLDIVTLPITSLLYMYLVFNISPTTNIDDSLFAIDDLSYLFLIILALLFLGSSVYSINFIKHLQRKNPDAKKIFINGMFKYTRIYVPLILLFVASMTGVIISRRFTLMWIFIEASTLSSAPLIYYHKDNETLEAVWKYLFICSVGVALAFVGVIAMVKASSQLPETSLTIDYLINNAALLEKPWVMIAFVFALIGFGVKMGLAPMHTWLPDAHSSAPASISALLSGSLLNCAFLVILRYYQILRAVDMLIFAKYLLIIFGVFSILISAVYTIRVNNFKRLLAYSSIEHMGILAIGVGLGGYALYAVMLHTFCHSLTKHSLFNLSGNFLKAYSTVDINKIKDGSIHLPINSILLLMLIFILLGLPPSGIFISEFILLKEMLFTHDWLILVIFSILLTVIAHSFITATTTIIYSPTDVEVQDDIKVKPGESVLDFISPMIFMGILILLGLHIPAWFEDVLQNAVKALGGV
ncbi:MAG: NADH dehydrogenase FAD-containing subunit [Nitrospirae bacterium]|nr:NADH dehydrogenase FAD-containing subunit [Nitrospirota bacterium]MBF0540791.1 NADH dehydrogenase FAD-containing subunit [Nitrospirota bacterium]